MGKAAVSAQFNPIPHLKEAQPLEKMKKPVSKVPLPPGDWLIQVGKRRLGRGGAKEFADVDGVQLPRASWTTCTVVPEKRLASELQELPRPNFKVFRKSARGCRITEPIPTVPWSEPRAIALGGDLFGDDERMGCGRIFAESQPLAF